MGYKKFLLVNSQQLFNKIKVQWKWNTNTNLVQELWITTAIIGKNTYAVSASAESNIKSSSYLKSGQKLCTTLFCLFNFRWTVLKASPFLSALKFHDYNRVSLCKIHSTILVGRDILRSPGQATLKAGPTRPGCLGLCWFFSLSKNGDHTVPQCVLHCLTTTTTVKIFKSNQYISFFTTSLQLVLAVYPCNSTPQDLVTLLCCRASHAMCCPARPLPPSHFCKVNDIEVLWKDIHTHEVGPAAITVKIKANLED